MKYQHVTIRASHEDELNALADNQSALGWEPVGGPYITPMAIGQGICLQLSPMALEAAGGIVYGQVSLMMRKVIDA